VQNNKLGKGSEKNIASPDKNKTSRERPTLSKWGEGVLFPLMVLYALTIFSQLVSLAFGRVNEDLSFISIVLPSIIFLSIITIPSAGIGLVLGLKVGLGAPLLKGLLTGDSKSYRKLARDAGLAFGLGVALGGLLLLIRHISASSLPPEILPYGYRGVIGGLAVSFGAAVGEEVWFRLGLMTVIVWCVVRLLGHRKTSPIVVWPVIVLTSVLFGMAHLPQLISYGAASPFAIGGTILGNTAVGILYGWCYWKRSLVSAMVAHFAVDIMIHVLPAFMPTLWAVIRNL